MSEVKLVGYSSDGLEAKWHLYIFPHNEKRYYAKGLTLYDKKIVRYVGLMPKPNKSHWDINNSDDCIIKQIKKIQDAYGKGIPQSQSVLRKPSWAKLDNGDGKGFEGDLKLLSHVIDPRLIIFGKNSPTKSQKQQVLNSNEYFVYLVRGEKRYYKIHKEFTDPEIKFLGISALPGKATVKASIRLNKSDSAKIAIRKAASKLPELQHLLRMNIKDHEHQCCYCGIFLTQKNYTKDHIIPIDRGGTNALKNLKPCCETCNVEKDNMMLHTYIQFLNLKFGETKVNSAAYKLLQTKIINANEIAKEIGK